MHFHLEAKRWKGEINTTWCVSYSPEQNCYDIATLESREDDMKKHPGFESKWLLLDSFDSFEKAEAFAEERKMMLNRSKVVRASVKNNAPELLNININPFIWRNWL